MTVTYRVFVIGAKRFIEQDFKTLEAAEQAAEDTKTECSIYRVRSQLIAGWSPKTGTTRLKK